MRPTHELNAIDRRYAALQHDHLTIQEWLSGLAHHFALGVMGTFSFH
jgi:hypothetical protein